MALGGVGSTCINHRAIEAVGRCKQCGRPFCNTCRVTGPTGVFCGNECKQKHEAFVQRAKELEDRKGPPRILVKLRKLIRKLIFFLIVALILGVIGARFEIPVLSDLVLRIRGMLGV